MPPRNRHFFSVDSPLPLTNYLDDWIPLTPLEQMAQTEYDAIIVGSGAGGGAVLWRLSSLWRNSGKRIAVLEAGDLLLPTHLINLPTFDDDRMKRYITNPKFLNPSVEPWPEFQGANQFMAVGGRTLHWGTISPRFHPSDFRYWPFPYSELVPYYQIAERVMNVNREYQKGSGLQDIFVQSLLSAGFPETENLPMAVDLEPTRLGYVHSNVFFSSIIFMAYALNLRPFDISAKARALRIMTDNGKAAGVIAAGPDKKEVLIRGKTVILSASTFENPRILLNSGIRGEAIGRYLTNHSYLSASLTGNRMQFPEVTGVVGVRVPGTDERPFQLQVHGVGPYEYYFYHYKEKPLMHELVFSILGFGIVQPRYDNYVTLDPGRLDAYQMPKLNVRFSYGKQDQEVLQHMAAAIEHAARAMGLTFKHGITFMKPGTDQHESGTCRMGDDPATSAVNRYGQIHGVPGLFAADNSVLPFLGSANPTLTTVAVAIRTADYIVQQMK